MDGVNIAGEDTTAPYAVSWDSTLASNGSHTLTAVARDAAGNTNLVAGDRHGVERRPPPGLVAAYGFDAGTGTTTPISPATATTARSRRDLGRRSGKFGNALTFDGTNDLVTRRGLRVARSDDRDDARGVGQADRARQRLAHGR